MHVVPVIDLKAGVVVRARLGQREGYRPIETPLSPTSDPVDVARGLRALHPFTTLYLADLDAIMGGGDNGAAIARLRAACPDLTLWVDNGIADHARATAWLDAGLGCLVLGSESQRDARLLQNFAGDPRIVLSLDYRGTDFVGPPAVLDAALWPPKVIAMTLARVGSGAGPDLDRLAAIRAAAPDRAVYAAGGVRDAADLDRLTAAGIAGALVATSLHDGRLGRDALRRAAADRGTAPHRTAQG
jgi:phosphoribosylformimino-5-aminoimidazole carboxamide ribotide isomerase